MPGQSSDLCSIDIFDILRVFAVWGQSPDEATWNALSDSALKTLEPPGFSGGSSYFY